MAEDKRQIVVCSCEDTMPLDIDTIAKACRGADVVSGRQFCRSELDRFRALLPDGGDLTVACTQETPVFEEAAAEAGDRALTFVNIREMAGWSNEATKAAPKMAALLAAAAEPMPAIPFVGLQSDGVILIYGRDERAIEAAELLKDHLDVTVLIAKPDHLTPRRKTEFPVVEGHDPRRQGLAGRVRTHRRRLCAACAVVARRADIRRTAQRRGVEMRHRARPVRRRARCFPAADLRDGYLRADPGDPAAMLRAVMKARDLTGTFDKPRYVTYDAEILRTFAVAASSAAAAVSISARPARSRRQAITSRSSRKSAPAAGNARRSARPALRAMHCRRPTS